MKSIVPNQFLTADQERGRKEKPRLVTAALSVKSAMLLLSLPGQGLLR